MSELIKHECGIAFVRLLKPLEYYYAKYGTSFYGLNKMYLLMEKQHNRGQDGAGIANIKIDHEPGLNYISRVRSVASQPIQDVFQQRAEWMETILKNRDDVVIFLLDRENRAIVQNSALKVMRSLGL